MKTYQKMIEEIKKYQPVDEIEEADYQSMMEFIHHYGEDAFLRTSLNGHMSASCLVVNENHDRVLMAYHLIYQSYGWLGGHADGEYDLESVARRELFEETGVSKMKKIYDGIASIEVLNVKSHMKRGKYVSSHLHFNVTYLFECSDELPIRIKADENSSVKWIKIEDIDKVVTEPKLIKIYKKILKRLEY